MAGKWQVRLSGTGGQGIIRGAMLLAQAALYDGSNAVQSQVYGPESRGGATKGEVVIAPDTIYYPKVIFPNLTLCMSPEAYKKFGRDVAPGGFLIVDSSVATGEVPEGAILYHLPMVETAREGIGNEMSANIVALGAMVAATGIVTEESIKEAIGESFKGKVLEANMAAFELGKKLVEEFSHP